MGASKLIHLLEPIVGTTGLLHRDDVHGRSTDPFVLRPNECELLVRPASTEELSEVMKVLCEHRQPVVVQGGLTGVTGGAGTSADQVAISLERMNEIESVNAVTGTVLAQAGVPIQALEEAAAEQGMFYPLDLGSRGTATVGGTIATNAGGNRVLRWGMTRNLVLGLEVVLADGRVMSSLNTLIKNNTGYDTKQLFIGSEGTLGIVTRAVLQLVPASRSNNVALVACSDYGNVLDLLRRARQLQGLSAFEVMWKDFYRIVTAAEPRKRVMNDAYAYYILIETLGQNPERDQQAFEEFLGNTLELEVIADAVIATSQRQYTELWSIRDSVEAIAREMAPMLAFDISVPIDQIPEYLNKIESRLSAEFDQFRACYFGHLGDSNIHIAMTIGDATDSDVARAESLVYTPIGEMRASVSAEHGIGKQKREYLGLSKSEEEIHLMKTFKRSLDPHNLLNPGVIFTLD